MKIKILIFILLILTSVVKSNEIEIIELHSNKSLDEMVLEKVNEQNSITDSDENETDINNEQISNEDIIENDNTNVVDLEIIETSNFWNDIELNELNFFLNNSNNIKSELIKAEFMKILSEENFDYSIEKNRNIFFIIVKNFYKNGEINKAYELLNSRNYDNDKEINFFKLVEFNYLLSTFQLDTLCENKDISELEFKLDYNLLDKIDIFCLILQNKLLEAELQNSIMLETTNDIDNNFQELYQFLIGSNESIDLSTMDFDQQYSSDLIFLYSAMSRIGDIPLNDNFFKIDPNNLAIPVILNSATNITTRLKAANIAFLNEIINIESLAALYQSVDFNSNELNKPEDTINQLSNNKEMLMAFYYQLTNIQIFPSERLNVLIDFWMFAKENNLEKIAYQLSTKIITSIELNSQNASNGVEIALSYIYNKKYEEAQKWNNLYESSKGVDDKSTYVNLLLDLYKSDDLQPVIDFINLNSEKLTQLNDKQTKELVILLLNVIQGDNKNIIEYDFNDIFDDRKMPSLMMNNLIVDSINFDKNNKFIFLVATSINDLEWSEIHPEHLKIILEGFTKYEDGILMKPLILEIFKSYKIL